MCSLAPTYTLSLNKEVRRISTTPMKQQKNGIRLNTVEKRSSADNWRTDKAEYQKSMSAEITSRVFGKHADALAAELKMADNLSDTILKCLETDNLQFHRHIIYQNGIQQEVVLSKLDTQAILNITKSIKLLTEIKMSILGIAKVEHRDRMEIARDKLQLERERLEFEKQKSSMLKDEDQHATGVVILPEVIGDD